jgi:acetyl esterase/lipase
LLDLYEPVSRDRPLPVIVWIHGGSWAGGSKDFCPLAYIATQSVAVVSINYRLSDVAPFPAQIHDCKAAIRWLRANSGKYQLDPDHIGVFGASAGGHLAALLGTTEGVKELEGDGGNPTFSSRVQAVCAFYPPTDLDRVMTNPRDRATSTSAVARFLGGSLEQHRDVAALANPNRYVTPSSAPFFILHGSADTLVPIRHSELLTEALRAKGVEVIFEVALGKGHGIAAPPGVAPKIIDFFQRHLGVR